MIRRSHDRPGYLIVDLRDVFLDYTSTPRNYHIYERFPLREIVQAILTTSAYGDNGEYLWDVTEKKLDAHFEVIDISALEFFYMLLTEYIDETIRRLAPKDIDTGEYIFHKWLNATTLILAHETATQVHGGVI